MSRVISCLRESLAISIFFTAMMVLFLASPDSARSEMVKSWAAISSGDRFVVLSSFNNEAVLDKETGLIWLKQIRANDFASSYIGSIDSCATRFYGGRKGWRLPTYYEVSSLLVPFGSSGGALPPGHPFVFDGPGSVFIPTMTNIPGSTGSVRSYSTSSPQFAFFDGNASKTLSYPANASGFWCVRGGGLAPDGN